MTALDDAVWPRSLTLAGVGRMGSALLRGWRAGGLASEAIHVVDPHLDAETSALCIAENISLAPPRRPAEVLVLAVKPQVFATNAAAFAPLVGADTLVVSILAGTTLASLHAALPEAVAVVRAMPNLAAAIGRGATALAAESALDPRRRAIATTLLGAVGLVEWLDESMIDAVTAVSGSGPAYVFLLTECLAEAGVAAGLPRDVAARFARATTEGAGALLVASPERSPRELREAVTSPGGTTAAALEVLAAPDAMARLVETAVAAARRRAGELAR